MSLSEFHALSAYRLQKGRTAVMPMKSCPCSVQSLALHLIQLLDLVNRADNQRHQSLKRLAAQHRAANVFWNSRGSVLESRNRYTAENVVEELQLEAPSDDLRHNRDPRRCELGLDILDKAAEDASRTFEPELVSERFWYLADHMQFYAVLREYAVRYANEAAKIFLLRDPVVRTHHYNAARHAPIQTLTCRNLPSESGRQHEGAHAGKIDCESCRILIGDRSHEIDGGDEPPFERARLQTVLPEANPCYP